MNKKREQRDAATNGSKVRWSEEEADHVARVAYRLLAESMEEPLSSFEAVKQAQMEVLPLHRHRTIRQAKDLEATIIPIWKAMKAEEEKAQRAPDLDPTLDPSESDASPSSTERPTPLLPPHDPVPGEQAPESLQITAMQPASGHDGAPDEDDDGLEAVSNSEMDAGAHDRRQMVRWTDAEKMVVARESKRLLYGFSDMSPLDAIRKAVFGFLPESRQREIHTLGEVKWIHALWQQVETERIAEEAMQQAEDAQKEAARLAEEQAEKAALDPLSLNLDTLVKTIGLKIGQQLVESIGEHLQETLMQRLTHTLHSRDGTARLHAVPAAAPRNHLPRVTVVGLINQQAQDVERHFAEAIEFKFIKSQGSGGSGAHGGAGMLARGSNADVVISMTDFNGHDVDEAAKHLNVPFVRLNGSVSALKRWLTSWLNGEASPQTHHFVSAAG
nr:hypothetical protein [Paraburkholderia sp. BL8N3]